MIGNHRSDAENVKESFRSAENGESELFKLGHSLEKKRTLTIPVSTYYIEDLRRRAGLIE